MPCYFPLLAVRNEEKNPDTGKRGLSFIGRENCTSIGHNREILEIPCGKCLGCRMERSRSWALRCLLESELYDDNCFITLTYSDHNLPENNSLDHSHFQKFMKRLRKKFNTDTIRYYMCGEYGEKRERPHFHAILFNFDFPDREFWSYDRDIILYRSDILEKLWPFGFSTVGDMNIASAGYVARYVIKKVKEDDDKYIDSDRVPPYARMSRKKGIATDWYEKFKSDVYPHDYIIDSNGAHHKPPKFFDNKYELSNPDEFAIIKKNRGKHARENPHNSLDRRLECWDLQKQKGKRLKRSLDYDI